MAHPRRGGLQENFRSSEVAGDPLLGSPLFLFQSPPPCGLPAPPVLQLIAEMGLCSSRSRSGALLSNDLQDSCPTSSYRLSISLTRNNSPPSPPLRIAAVLARLVNITLNEKAVEWLEWLPFLFFIFIEIDAPTNPTHLFSFTLLETRVIYCGSG